MRYRVAFDTTDVVEESIAEVVKTLARGDRPGRPRHLPVPADWRSTIIPAITIPVSLVGTFAFVKLMGFSINTLTLFGIMLATGIVVDDAIVVIENIERHIQEYKKRARRRRRTRCARCSARSSRPASCWSRCSCRSAFFPGTTGRLYPQFSMTIAFSVALSVFNAVTLTPALSALAARRESHTRAGSSRGSSGHRRRHATWYVRALLGHAAALGGGVAVFVVGLWGATWWVYNACRRLRAGRGPRVLHRRRCRRPAGRLARVHGQRRAAGREDPGSDPDVMALFSVMGLQLRRRGPNQGIMFVRLKAVRRPDRRRAVRSGGPGACAAR